MELGLLSAHRQTDVTIAETTVCNQPIDNWDVSSATRINRMFASTAVFDGKSAGTVLPSVRLKYHLGAVFPSRVPHVKDMCAKTPLCLCLSLTVLEYNLVYDDIKYLGSRDGTHVDLVQNRPTR